MLRSYIWGPNKPQYWIVLAVVVGFGAWASHDRHASDGKFIASKADTWNGEWVGQVQLTPDPRYVNLPAPKHAVLYLDMEVLNTKAVDGVQHTGSGEIAIDGLARPMPFILDVYVGPRMTRDFYDPYRQTGVIDLVIGSGFRDADLTPHLAEGRRDDAILTQDWHPHGKAPRQPERLADDEGEGDLHLVFAPGKLTFLPSSELGPHMIPSGELHKGTRADYERLVSVAGSGTMT